MVVVYPCALSTAFNHIAFLSTDDVTHTFYCVCVWHGDADLRHTLCQCVWHQWRWRLCDIHCNTLCQKQCVTSLVATWWCCCDINGVGRCVTSLAHTWHSGTLVVQQWFPVVHQVEPVAIDVARAVILIRILILILHTHTQTSLVVDVTIIQVSFLSLHWCRPRCRQCHCHSSIQVSFIDVAGAVIILVNVNVNVTHPSFVPGPGFLSWCCLHHQAFPGSSTRLLFQKQLRWGTWLSPSLCIFFIFRLLHNNYELQIVKLVVGIFVHFARYVLVLPAAQNNIDVKRFCVCHN